MEENIGGISAGQLRSFIEKIENLEREKNDLLIKFEDLGIQLKTSQNLVGNLTLSLISAEVKKF